MFIATTISKKIDPQPSYANLFSEKNNFASLDYFICLFRRQ
jgi:hypothetical protein